MVNTRFHQMFLPKTTIELVPSFRHGDTRLVELLLRGLPRDVGLGLQLQFGKLICCLEWWIFCQRPIWNPWMMWMNVGWMYWINGSKIVGHCKSCPTNSGELHPTLRCDPTSMVVLNNIAHMWLLLGRWRNEKKCTACTFHRPIRLYPTSTWKMFQEKRMQKVMFQDLNRKRNGLERWCWKMTAKDLQSADWIIYIDHGDVHWTCFQFWATNNSS